MTADPPHPLSEKLERLAAAGIRVLPLPGIESHLALERDGFAVLAERSSDTIGRTGAAGLVTPQGLALLVWRDGSPFFVGRNIEQPAAAEQVTQLRAFAGDVERALAG